MRKPSFTFEKIKFATDSPTFERAVKLYEDGRVTHFEEGIGCYSAVVLGNKPYRVSVEARQYNLATCECYLGQRNTLCKHMVAVAIYAVKNGEKLDEGEKELNRKPKCSGKLGELCEEKLSNVKPDITSAMRYIKPYNGPSRIWFAYQNSLTEGCNRLAAIVSKLPVNEQTAQILVDLLLRLDKKISTSVDDSDGTVGGFMQEVVTVLQNYAELDPSCIKTFEKLCGRTTCFGWEAPLVDIWDNQP